MSNYKYHISFSEEDIVLINQVLSEYTPNSRAYKRASVLLELSQCQHAPVKTEVIQQKCNVDQSTIYQIKKIASSEGIKAAIFSESFRKITSSYSESDIEMLCNIINTSDPTTKLYTRAKVLLALNQSQMKINEIADACSTSRTTVLTIKSQLLNEGLYSTLYHEQICKSSDTSGVEKRIRDLLKCNPPFGKEKWSLSLLTDALNEGSTTEAVSRSTVYRVMKKNGISI